MENKSLGSKGKNEKVDGSEENLSCLELTIPSRIHQV